MAHEKCILICEGLSGKFGAMKIDPSPKNVPNYDGLPIDMLIAD